MRGGAIRYTELVLVTIVGRLGLGLIIPALTLATLRNLQPRLLGQASMFSNYARQLGGVLGIALVAVFVEWRASIHGRAAPAIFTAYSQAFVLLALAFGLALVAAVRMKPRG